MKTFTLKISSITLLLLHIIVPAFSQTNTGIDCGANTFYGQNGAIVSMSLDGGNVSIGDTVVPFITGVGGTLGLAYCNNLNGGSYSPTFYSTSATLRNAAYFDGTTWITTSAVCPGTILNAGGNGNYLYYTLSDTLTYKTNAIVRYDGNKFSVAHTWGNNQILTVADIAVDDDGNAWVFTGNADSTLTDSLNVISPSGQLIRQYPFHFDTYNGYGAFMLNKQLYLGLGSSNVENPNTLIPIIISFDSIHAGTPIPMPANNNFSDLASCNAGLPLAIPPPPVSATLRVFPNPANDAINISGLTANNGKTEIRIADAIGRIVYDNVTANSYCIIPTTSFVNGIYFINLINGRATSVQKVVVQH